MVATDQLDEYKINKDLIENNRYNINTSNLLSCQKKYAKEEFESVSTLINNNKS